jgi:hypothetical protein
LQIRLLKIKFTLEKAMTAQLYFLTSALDGGWVVNPMPRWLYPLDIDPVPIVQEAGWAPGPAWTDAEN